LAQATLTLVQYSSGHLTTHQTSRGTFAGMNPFCQKMLCLAALAGSATAGYTCSDGYMTKAGDALCATPYEAGCSKATCCTAPKTCASYSVAWITASVLNGGCAKANAKDFFDKKKISATVASPHGETQVKAACCTPFSLAKCSDWAGVYGCAAGTSLQKDNAAAPDGTDGKKFSDVAKFRLKCCVTTPKTCASYSVAWIAASLLNGGCAKANAKDFFDKKKMAVTVASPHGEAEVKAACCTPFSLAKCSDWAGLYGCAAGTNLLSTDAAAPDGTGGKTFTTLSKFRQVCCKAPLKCSAYTGNQVVSGAIMHATSLWVAVVGVIAMWVL